MGLFLVNFLVFENFEIVIIIRMSTFGGVCFLKLFDLKPPDIFFGFLETLGGLFWVLFFTFQNFEIGSRIRMPTFGGSVFYNFLIWVLLISVWHFVCLFVFENFEIVFRISIPTFGGSVFFNFFIWVLLIGVLSFCLFVCLFVCFWQFWYCIKISILTFGGLC